MHESLVSVIIPAFNSERYLGESINSVLSQTYRPIEIILVDDGSTDRTAGIAKEFGTIVRYHKQHHAGAASARNAGIQASAGEYLAFLDSDDLWLPEKLFHQIDRIMQNSGPEAVFTLIRQFSSPDLPPESTSRIRFDENPFPGYAPSTMLIRKDSLLRVGLFENEWKVGEFISWFARARDIGLKMELFPAVLAMRRIHQRNIENQKQHWSDHLKILKMTLDRRREQNGHQGPH